MNAEPIRAWAAATAAEGGEVDAPTAPSAPGWRQEAPQGDADAILDDRRAQAGVGLDDVLALAAALPGGRCQPVSSAQDHAAGSVRLEPQVVELDARAEQLEDVRGNLGKMLARRVIDGAKRHAAIVRHPVRSKGRAGWYAGRRAGRNGD